MRKKILIIVTVVSIALLSTACSYFFPSEKKILVPQLMESKDVIMPSSIIRKGDIIYFYDIEAMFIPEPTKLYTAELNRSGKVSNIYFGKSEIVKKGDLVLKLNTELIEDKIVKQEISLEKTQLLYENVQVMYELGKTDRYSMEFSKLSLESAENYLSDLYNELENCFVYAPVDGALVSLKFEVGDIASGEVFKVSKISDGIIEVLMITKADRSLAEEALMKLDIGDKVELIYEGEKYDGEIFRDISKYYMDIEYDSNLTHTQITIYEIPDGIGFEKRITLRNIILEAIDVIVIPVSGIYAVDEQPYTYVLNDNKMEKRMLELGVTDDYFYEVISGLAQGEYILKIN